MVLKTSVRLHLNIYLQNKSDLLCKIFKNHVRHKSGNRLTRKKPDDLHSVLKMRMVVKQIGLGQQAASLEAI